MTRAQALAEARRLLGPDAQIEDRRRRKANCSLAGNLVVSVSGMFGFNLVRGWGPTYEAALAATRKQR